MATTTNNSTEDAMERSLSTCVFLPPKPRKTDFKLFRALEVKLGEDGRAKFRPLGLGIDEKFLLESGMNEQILALQGFLGRADTERLNYIKLSLDLSNTRSGNVGDNLREFVNANVNGGTSANSRYTLTIKGMEMTSIEQTIDVGNFLKACVPGFCNRSGIIPVGLETNNKWFAKSENIEYGFAFVTSYIAGSIVVKETDYSSYVNLSVVAAGNTNVGLDAGGERDRKITLENDSEGIVGIRVYFVHLVKNEKVYGDLPNILNIFPVNKNNDENLKKAFKGINAKGFRKIFDSIDTEVMVMHVTYGTREEFAQSSARLHQRVNDEPSLTSARDGGVNSHQTASLSTVIDYADSDIDDSDDDDTVIEDADESNDTEIDSSEQSGNDSNNILYTSSLEELQMISKAILRKGTINVQGKLVNGIKPVIYCKMRNLLPIIYRLDLSGTTKSGRIPNWVLRVEDDLSILVKISGHIGNSGIVTVYDNIDWHVREFVEFVNKDNTERIEELKGQGFFRLDPVEAAGEKEEDAVQSGALVMMGRQLLALKKEAVMAAVKKDGMALQYASNEMKADREVVLAAVKEDDMALQFASDELKADEEVLSYVVPLTN